MKVRNKLVVVIVVSSLWLCMKQTVLAAHNPLPPLSSSRTNATTAGTVIGMETLLGPGDMITLATPEIEELDRRTLTVDGEGQADVPSIGRIKCVGFTPSELAAQIQAGLRRIYLNPRVSIASVDVKSRPISVVGAVNTPGVQQADGRKRLLEVLSLAGGLRQDSGTRIEVTRSAEIGGLPKALFPRTEDGFETVEVPVSDLIDARRPQDNFTIQGGDVITVPKAQLVYVVGEVKKGGGFVIGEHGNLTVLKALALAEGIQSTADSAHARILRAGDDSDGRPFNVAKLLRGQVPDVPLRPDDVLFIPSSVPKKAAVRVMEAAIQTGTGIAIWR